LLREFTECSCGACDYDGVVGWRDEGCAGGGLDFSYEGDEGGGRGVGEIYVCVGGSYGGKFCGRAG
jgi:hypothetical protein